MNQKCNQRFQRLRAHEVSDWCRAHPDALILDARDPVHHARGHLPGSVRLDGRNHERLLMREGRARPVFLYCYHGNASQIYAEMFIDFGFAQVADLIGGWEAWCAWQLANHARGLALASAPLSISVRSEP